MFVCVVLVILTVVCSQVHGEAPKFRILAPEFICPEIEGTLVKSDNTVITLQIASGSNFDVTWTVRWTPLHRPSQRFTLMLWKAVRALETRLNRPPIEPYVFMIENNALLKGVDYIFNVSSVEPDGTVGMPKSFHIDNTLGDQKLDMIEGRNDMLSVSLLGGQVTYADLGFVLQAQVTTCSPTEDYYFVWTIQSIESSDSVDAAWINGSRLEVSPYSLKAGMMYDANCEVIKQSNGYRITQTGLPFSVSQRGLKVYLSVDYLKVSINHPFDIEAYIDNRDYKEDDMMISWKCTTEGASCDLFDAAENNTLAFPSGISKIGQYVITVSVSVLDQSATASAIIVMVENSLPVLQMSSMSRILNEATAFTLVANASNVAPTCSLTWYFASNEFLTMNNDINSSCADCEHGEALSDTLTIYSLQENFLNELTDFTNETEWRQVTAEMTATSGRARFVAQCGCSLTFECKTMGTVHADINFQLNENPKPSEVMVSPKSGYALETVFRISTMAAVDPDTPLTYSFYCGIGANESLLLASFVEHFAVETTLPYVEGDLQLWVEVCDTLGACSKSEPKLVQLTASDGATLEEIIEEVRGHIRRCELMQLTHAAISALLSFEKAGQHGLKSRFSESLVNSLRSIHPDCVQRNHIQYTRFTQWLNTAGIEICIN